MVECGQPKPLGWILKKTPLFHISPCLPLTPLLTTHALHSLHPHSSFILLILHSWFPLQIPPFPPSIFVVVLYLIYIFNLCLNILSIKLKSGEDPEESVRNLWGGLEKSWNYLRSWVQVESTYCRKGGWYCMLMLVTSKSIHYVGIIR